jgi:hypothetical protein
MDWRLFTAGEAEKITGMSPALQRNKRLRGQLTPLSDETTRNGKAALHAVLLGEMVFIGEASKLGIGTIPDEIVVKNLTVRAVAAQWIAYWALLTNKGAPHVDDREGLARKLLQLRADRVAPTFAFLPVKDEPTWKNVVWTSDPADALKSERLAVAVNLKALGEQMAARSGALVQDIADD